MLNLGTSMITKDWTNLVDIGSLIYYTLFWILFAHSMMGPNSNFISSQGMRGSCSSS